MRDYLKLSHRDIRKLFTQSAEVGYNFDIKRFPQVQAVAFKDNFALQQAVSAAVKLAQSNFTNITQTIGMIDPYGNALPLQDVYRSATDFAFQQVFTGVTDYNTAIRRATSNIAKYGLRTINYQSGVHTGLEAAIRRNIMGGLGLMQEHISQQNHDTLGADGWEISAHAASAPDHEPIQGKQYTDAEYQALNDSLVRRIGTLNCGHAAFPIILGVSKPQYTLAELAKFKADNTDGITYQGQHYTSYEATQQQRALERSMRYQKRRVLVANASGDAEQAQTAKTRLTLLQQEYRRFSKAAGLPTQYERAAIAA
ncbi:Phage minor capsid protein 2 [anaerobic digester metagenome]